MNDKDKKGVIRFFLLMAGILIISAVLAQVFWTMGMYIIFSICLLAAIGSLGASLFILGVAVFE